MLRRWLAVACVLVLLLSGSVSSAVRYHGNSPSSADSLAIEATRSGDGYYTVDVVGGVFAHGDADFHGSLPELRQDDPSIGSAPTVDLSVTASGDGYWIVDRDGGVFSFGDARFFGSIPGLRRQGHEIGPGDVVDLAPVGNRGYYLMDSAGGVFAFGDLPFHGSIPELRNQGHHIPASPVSLVPLGPDGYWMLDSSGGVFTFGDANFFGSLPGRGVEAEAVAMSVTRTRRGYWILDSDGIVHAFGDAQELGSVREASGGLAVDMATPPDGGGYWVLLQDGRVFTFKKQPPPENDGEESEPEREPDPEPPPGSEDSDSNVVAFQDSLGDVPYCRGDIDSHAGGYGNGVISVGAALLCGSDPHTDLSWTDGFTGFAYNLDTDRDGVEEYHVFIHTTGSYEYTVRRASDFEAVCSGLAEWDGGNVYGAAFSSACVGSPSSYTWNVSFFWDTFDDISQDDAPNDLSFVGPVRRP